MIIWNGLGFLVCIFIFGCSFSINLLTNYFFSDSFYGEHKWPFGVALILAGILCFVLNLFLHKRKNKILIDKETGEEVEIKNSHSLFFIEVRWWGYILPIGGLIHIIIDFLN